MGGVHHQDRAWQLQLLNGWELRSLGEPLHAPVRMQRLVAFLALQGSRPRGLVAAELWPDSNEAHARSNLRTTVVHVHRVAPGLLMPERDPLALSAHVGVDVAALRVALSEPSDVSGSDLTRALLDTGELLPGWYDDWVLSDRERLRQRRINLLDRLSGQLLDEGNLPLASAAALTCVALEPLRESPHRTLVRIHLTQGDRVEAFRVYQGFRRRSIAEFGLAPDTAFQHLMEPLLDERRRRLTH